MSLRKRRAWRGRRRVAAAVAGIALPLLLAGWSARAGSAAAPSATPASASQGATPCPIIVVGTPDPSCQAVNLGGSTPTAAPASSSGGGGTPPPTSAAGGPGGSGGGAGGSSSGAVAPGSSSGAAGGAGSGVAAGANINPPPLLGLLTVLNAPPGVGVEQPLLHHFTLVGSTTATSAVSSPRTGILGLPGGIGAGLALALLCAVAVAGVAAVASRRFPLVHGRRRLIAALPVVAAGVLGALMLGAHSGGAVASTPPTTAATVAAPLEQHHVDALAAPVFDQLTAIENNLTSVGQRLTLVAGSANNADAMKPSVGAAHQAARQQAAELLAAQLASQYAAEVQTEYSFYTTVVANSTQRAQLLSAAAVAPAPIAAAVSYNVTAVQAMLQQEAAINAAQSAAQTVQGPAPTSLMAPEQGFITQGFGPTQFLLEPPLTFGGHTYPHFHTGVDIANVLDTPVHAAANGVVVIAGSSVDSKGNLIGYGNYIVIQHAGHMITLYGHLAQLLVKVGQVVKQGQVIGLEGSTGYSTGPHLHFEVRINGLLANPLTYLGKQLA